jgi:tryptophan synthase alpha chain
MSLDFKTKPGLVAYITCGDPNLAASERIVLSAIDAGADVIELGVPFSDPVADGPVIQRASARALKNRTSLAQVLELAAKVRTLSANVGLIVFSYWNPVLRFGVERFCEAAKQAGIDGALITDLTVEEGDESEQLVARLQRFSQLPIAVGFGISNTEQFQAVGAFADAAVVGSAIVQIIEQSGNSAAVKVAEFIRELKRNQDLPRDERKTNTAVRSSSAIR